MSARADAWDEGWASATSFWQDEARGLGDQDPNPYRVAFAAQEGDQGEAVGSRWAEALTTGGLSLVGGAQTTASDDGRAVREAVERDRRDSADRILKYAAEYYDPGQAEGFAVAAKIAAGWLR